MNYTLTEYARDVVRSVAEVCKQEKVPHPTLVSESGRATVAHHSVLLVEVFGTIAKTLREFAPAKEDDPEFVRQLSDLVVNLNRKNRRESLHDGLTVKEEAAARFDLGLLDLATKARVEDNFWHLISRIAAMYSNGRPPPEEVKVLMERDGWRGLPGSRAIGYHQVALMVEGKMGKKEVWERIVADARAYAKRQLTWFRGVTNLQAIVTRPATTVTKTQAT